MVQFAAAGSTFTIQLAPHEKRCYYENLIVRERLDLSFQVGSGGSLDVDFWVSNPENRLLYSVFRQSTATYGFVAEQPGKYEYCFSNQMSSVTDKTLSFSVMGPDERMNVKPEKEAISIDPLDQAIRELSDGLMAIKDEQSYMEARERAHRKSKHFIFYCFIFVLLRGGRLIRKSGIVNQQQSCLVESW